MSALPDDLIDRDFTQWIVVSAGEGVQPFPSKEEAVASAKEQASETPNLVLGIYRLEHFVCARVQAPKLFDAPDGAPE